uniref:Uncharacterized protein n=1 Tax=Avena sativa TaxID=4498 RepID=A0ACD5XGI2_AVESA
MAAAPAEVPTPLTTPDLPPAKRRKKDPTRLEISPAVPAAAAEGWSSLPDDLVRRIADSFLATNDLDCYVSLRAVCPSWRAATDDPKKDTSDVRFHPQTWIVLDGVFPSHDDELLLLNVSTGRFLHKKLPLLRDYYVVATISGGFFVLADRSPPHAVSVFNPLSGDIIPFRAPMPLEVGVDFVADKQSLFGLVFLGNSCKIYTAFPDSEGFISRDCQQGVHNFLLKAVVGGAYLHIFRPAFVHAFAELADLVTSLRGDFVTLFSSDLPEDANDIQCFLVDLDMHMVLFMKVNGIFNVFKMNTEIGKLVKHVPSIGNFAIFIGHRRCLSVDANKFPGIEANCVYYTEHLGLSAHIFKCNIKDKKVEMISEAAEFVKQDKQFILVPDRPFTIIQLLCSYTVNTPDSQLALQQMS